MEDPTAKNHYVFPAPGYLSVEQYANSKGVPKDTMFGYFKGEKMKGSYFVDRRGYKNVDPKKADEILAQPTVREQMNQKRLEQGQGEKSGNIHQYTEARAANEVIKAQMAQLELQEMKGSLVRVDLVKKEQFLFARALRDQLMNIPERNAAILAAETDARTISDLLNSEIRMALKAVETILEGQPDA